MWQSCSYSFTLENQWGPHIWSYRRIQSTIGGQIGDTGSCHSEPHILKTSWAFFLSFHINYPTQRYQLINWLVITPIKCLADDNARHCLAQTPSCNIWVLVSKPELPCFCPIVTCFTWVTLILISGVLEHTHSRGVSYSRYSLGPH